MSLQDPGAPRYIEVKGGSTPASAPHHALDALLAQRLAPQGPQARPPGEDDALHPQDVPHLDRLHDQLFAQYLDPISRYIRRIQRRAVSREGLGAFLEMLRPLLSLSQTLQRHSTHLSVVALMDATEALMASRGRATFSLLWPFAQGFETLLGTLSHEIREAFDARYYYQEGSNDLLEALRQIHYIGPRRIQRLYAAGLITAEAICGADPQDMVQVTGISLDLCREIGAVTRAFIEERRGLRRDRLAGLMADLNAELQALGPRDLDLIEGREPALTGLLHTLGETLRGLERGRFALPTPPGDSP